ncbi:MAG: N-acetyltransferase [Alphaproteobacteria bacterium]|nr:N-acetyltransferase [Alphaproteobacteria bacterium]
MTPVRAYELVADSLVHSDAVRALFDEVFGPGRFAKTAERLREGNRPIPEASFVAIDEEGVAGVVRLWPVRVGDKRAAFLGPLAVAPRRRGDGVAFKLMERSIGVCREIGFPAVILVGDEGYYSRWMFKRAISGRFVLPGPVNQDRVLVRDLSPAAVHLEGEVRVEPDGANH